MTQPINLEGCNINLRRDLVVLELKYNQVSFPRLSEILF